MLKALLVSLVPPRALESVEGPWAWAVGLAVVLEGLCGGALTTATFAFMMQLSGPGECSPTDAAPAPSATLYTVLATVEVGGKVIPASLSGVLADAWGYPAVYWLALAVTVATSGLVYPVSAHHPWTGPQGTRGSLGVGLGPCTAQEAKTK
jgi:hypothetical protein